MELREYAEKYLRVKNYHGGYRELSYLELVFLDNVVHFVGKDGQPLDNRCPRGDEVPKKPDILVCQHVDSMDDGYKPGDEIWVGTDMEGGVMFLPGCVLGLNIRDKGMRVQFEFFGTMDQTFIAEKDVDRLVKRRK